MWYKEITVKQLDFTVAFLLFVSVQITNTYYNMSRMDFLPFTLSSVQQNHHTSCFFNAV